MSAHRRGTELGRLAVAAALVPLALACGCESSTSGPPSIAERAVTPEGQLENVMKRLEFALEHARPAAGTAIVSKRVATHRLVEPAGDRKAYEAEVTITMSAGLAPDKVEEIKKVTGSKVEPPPAEAKADAEIAELKQDPAERIAEAATVSEEKVYKLRFQADRWELVDPPAANLSGPDKLCFQYALSDG